MKTASSSYDTLGEPVAQLCEELGIATPPPNEQGVFVIQVEGQELRFSLLNNDRVYLLGVLGRVDEIAAQRQISRQALLTGCLTLQAVRFGKLGREEVLSIEPETDELILWHSLDGPDVSIPAFFQTAEALLNELEFWKNWLAHP
ncbi:Tir chaperone family protein CesT [Prosthecobacter fusiformis]|uniref:Tir chaperone family protein CesT n=1 Tax=Prosthecobacter fusiformis TaxID=48464 RepID=A0A4R7S017_9BACT|nr:type III secretion system chaperone [Prosthecobacter fusiformis]TDU70708.1 Tir chaperone family protein CesT [Prosthecobacter fusiformis]